MNERRNLLTGLHTKDELLDLGFIEGNDVKTECGSNDVICFVAVPLSFLNKSILFDVVSCSTSGISSTDIVEKLYCNSSDSFFRCYWDKYSGETYNDPAYPVANVFKYWDFNLKNIYSNNEEYGETNKGYVYSGNNNKLWSGDNGYISPTFAQPDVFDNKTEFYIISCYGCKTSSNGHIGGKCLKPRGNSDYSGCLFLIVKDKVVTFNDVKYKKRPDDASSVSLNFDTDAVNIHLFGATGYYCDIVNTYSLNLISADNRQLTSTAAYEKSQFGPEDISGYFISYYELTNMEEQLVRDLTDDNLPGCTLNCVYKYDSGSEKYCQFLFYIGNTLKTSFYVNYNEGTGEATYGPLNY